jgi:hypothetical protein
MQRVAVAGKGTYCMLTATPLSSNVIEVAREQVVVVLYPGSQVNLNQADQVGLVAM